MARALAATILSLAALAAAEAWEVHPLISYPMLESLPEAAAAGEVRAEALEDFVLAAEDELAALLAAEEAWARKNVPEYPPLPEAMAFRATGDGTDARLRLLRSLRMTPIAKIPLYVQKKPGEEVREGRRLEPVDLTYLKDIAWMEGLPYESILAGENVSALAVCATASDEPDLGLDIGLYEDNGSAWGKDYGMGAQPFGNPNLEYGSQAPIHMGLYQEAAVLYKFGPFLRKTLPEWRIRQCKALAELAFRTGHDYWGWRFAGWGLHYLADLCQPYHARILPGVSTARALWINALSMLGNGKPYAKAVQLVSNRHMALERYGRELLEKAYREGGADAPLFAALGRNEAVPAWEDSFPRTRISEAASKAAAKTDRLVAKSFPKRLVSDPKVELASAPELYDLMGAVASEKGAKSAEALEAAMAGLLDPCSAYGKSYLLSILAEGRAGL